MAYNQNKREL